MEISMKSIVSAISLALDLADNNWNKLESLIDTATGMNYCSHKFTNHCKTTAYIALEIGGQLNLSKETYYNLYISSLIHDIGTQNIFDQAHNSSVYMKKHCVEGYDMLKDIPSLSYISKIIKYHHENFNKTGCFHLSSFDTPIEAQIIRLADIIETLIDYEKHYYTNMNNIITWVKDRANILFSPELVNAFLSAASKESFWLNLQNKNIIDSFIKDLSPEEDTYISLHEFELISMVFAKIIDNKSAFTAYHSRGISSLAYRIATHLGYDDEKALKMKIAGLLHDIGKIAIPCEILDKNGPLDDEEFSIIKSHVYYTNLILSRINNIEDICSWAANHHENLMGTGYPRRLGASELSEECRIIAVCDVYQALTEDRPYRKGLTNDEAFNIMDNMVLSNRLCNKALDSLKAMILS